MTINRRSIIKEIWNFNALRDLIIAWGFERIPVFWSFFFLLLVLYVGRVWLTIDSVWKVLRCLFMFNATVTAVLQSWGILMWKTFKDGLGINQCHLASRDFIFAKMPIKIIGIIFFLGVIYMEIIEYLQNDINLLKVCQRKCTWLRKLSEKGYSIKKIISYKIRWPLKSIYQYIFHL